MGPSCIVILFRYYSTDGASVAVAVTVVVVGIVGNILPVPHSQLGFFLSLNFVFFLLLLWLTTF